MARTKSLFTLSTTHFDFRRARVRGSKDGKTWEIEDKFDLSYILEHIDFHKYHYAYNIYSYRELKECLLEELQEAKYPNVHIITNEKQ